MHQVGNGISQHESPADKGSVVINGNFTLNTGVATSYITQVRGGVVIAGPGWQDAEHMAVLREALFAAGFVELERNVHRWAWSRSVQDTQMVHELSFEGYVQGKSWIADGIWVKACTVARGDRGARRMLRPALENIDSSFTSDGISHVAHILQGFSRNEHLWQKGGALEPFPD